MIEIPVFEVSTVGARELSYIIGKNTHGNLGSMFVLKT